MKYDTSPLSIDTLDVKPAPPSNELRFVPADQNIHQTTAVDDTDSGPISQATVLSRNVGFDTFIEDRQETNSLGMIAVGSSKPNYRSWIMIGLLAAASAVAGGSSVYFLSSSPNAVVVEQKPSVSNNAVTDVQPSETFVVKSPNERAAEDPLVPHSPEVTGQPARPPHPLRPREGQPSVDANSNVQAAISGPDPSARDIAPPAAVNEPQPKPPEREAKVGGYVVEKPTAGRKPLARCADGTYSFSASRSAACSGRGGISEWMADGKPASNAPVKQAAYVLGPRGGCYYLDSSNKKIYVEKKYCE